MNGVHTEKGKAMSRYIDADKLMLDIRLDKRPTFRGAKIPPSVKETMFAYLDSAPHIDIVKCKECKRWNTNGCHLDVGECEWAFYMTKPDDYCSYGEREGE